MNVQRLTDIGFLAAGASWNALLASSLANAFFLRHDVLAAWWKHFGGTRALCVLEMSEGDRVVGYAPLCITRESGHGLLPVREAAFMGREALTGDYLDFIAAPGREIAVAGAALDWLLAHPKEWDLLRISDVREGSPTIPFLQAVAPDLGLETVRAKGQTCPFLPLPPTWDAFMADCSANMRSNLRRREKKILAAGGVFTRVTGGAIAGVLDAMFELHGARWETRGKSGNFIDPRTRALHHALAPALDADGTLGLWTLTMEGKVVAAIYGFRHGATFHYFQAGFDPAFAEHGVGLALMGHAIRACIAWGITEFDYLRGDEDYKRRWTDKARTTHSFVVPRPSLVGWSWKALGSAKEAAKQLLRRPAPASTPAQPSGLGL